MPHIHTEPGQHDLTTTAFIIRTDEAEPRGLLHRHKTLGLLLPVGGHVELHETPWAASIHEIAEESGYEIDQLKVLQPNDRIKSMSGVKTHPVPLFLQTHEFKKGEGHSHIDLGFLYITDQSPRNLPAKGESRELLWLSANEIQNRQQEMPPDVAQIYDFCFNVALRNWDLVNPDWFDA